MAEIEYFYSAHSSFTYLGSARFMQIAEAAGRRIVHRPMLLDRIVAAAGSTGFAERSRAYQAYFFGRETERWAQYRGVEIMRGMPQNHRADMTLPNSVLIAALHVGHNIDPLAHAMLQAHWRDDADLTDPTTLAAIVDATGMESEPLLEGAGTPEVLGQLNANTEEAIARSVFGSPTYFVDGDMYYGQDRLELVERALEQPFDGVWPRDDR